MYRGAQEFRNIGCGIAARTWQHDGELLAAIAGDKINGTGQGVFQGIHDGDQALIALLVPMCIIIRFEVIDIDHEQAERRFGPVRALHFQRQMFHEKDRL